MCSIRKYSLVAKKNTKSISWCFEKYLNFNEV